MSEASKTENKPNRWRRPASSDGRSSHQGLAMIGTAGRVPRTRWAARVLGALLVLTLIAIGAAACDRGVASTASAPTTVQPRQVAVDGGSYFEVEAAGLATMLKNKDFPLINVHVPYEGEIEPTDLFIPYDQIEANLAKLPADKGAKIFLYCRSGSMSSTAARALAKLGYTNVWHLAGGTIGWKAAGYAVVEKPR